MGYVRYTREKSARARRQDKFAKKQKSKSNKPRAIEDDEVLVPHPTSPRAFIVKKK